MQIELKRVRTLDIESPTSPGRVTYLAAASGLVRVGSSFFVVADDELSIGVFDIDPAKPGTLVRVIPGRLPDEHKARKKLKPDFEAICVLGASQYHAHGALMILPSGSKRNRTRGAIIPFAEDGKLLAPHELRFEQLYSALEADFEDLNIEGAVCVGTDLVLLQRGNAKSNQNGMIKIDLDKFLAEAGSNQSVTDSCLTSVHRLELGHLNDVPLSFTDAAISPGGEIYFLAAAEATESTYDDGEFRGAVVGRIQNGRAHILSEIRVPAKPEGLWIEKRGEKHQFFVVTDADDLSKPSELFTFEI